MSVAPCEHSLSILHAQHQCVWRRPPWPVLGSFHLLLPLVEISFVSVPAAQGLDHLELCKHPYPTPHQTQASPIPVEAPVRLITQTLLLSTPLPDTMSHPPFRDTLYRVPPCTALGSFICWAPSPRPYPSKSLLPHGCPRP